MNIVQIIERLEANEEFGLELSRTRGLLSSTWAVYKENGFYYYFDISEDFIFDEAHKYTRDELVNELGNANFEILGEIA